MKAKLDFEAKTIELECEPTLEQVALFQRSLKDWREWRIIAPVLTVSVPTVWTDYASSAGAVITVTGKTELQ